MIRVLMITASAGYGGGPQHILDLAAALRGKVRVDIACPRQEPFYDRFRQVIDGEIVEIPERRFTLRDATRLLRFVRSQGITLLHSHGKGAGVYGRFIAALGGLPLVHTPHGIHVGQYARLMRLFYLSYEWLTGGIEAQTIFVSPSEQTMARGLGIGRASRSVVICNGVPVPEDYATLAIARNRLRRAQGIGDDEIVVVTLSRFDYAKNMDEMVHVAELARNLRFWFLGNGADYARVKAAVDERRMDHVWLPGFVTQPIEYLAAADLYLSTSRWEGMPLAVLQAMSLSKPVIASDVTGNRDVVVHGHTGYLYPPGQPEVAAGYLTDLSENREERHVMGTAGKYLQKTKFSVTEMARRTLNIYESVLSMRV